MANLRLVYDNSADRTTSLVASTTSGSYAVTNMLTERKGQPHRSTGTSVTYDLTWTTGELIGAVVLPASNLTGAATIRVRLYSDTAMTALLADSGTITACPGLSLSLWNWNAVLNANAFAYGGASKTAVWFTQNYSGVKGCKIELVDPTNGATYIDCSRLVVGWYWTPAIGAAYGATMTMEDTSESARTHAGDNPTERGTRYEVLSFDLQHMAETDRATLTHILRNIGKARNFFVSLFPGQGSYAEQDHMIYGKRSSNPMSFDAYNSHSNRFDIDGW